MRVVMKLKHVLLIALLLSSQFVSAADDNKPASANKPNFTEIDQDGKIKQRYLFEEDSKQKQEDDLVLFDQQIKMYQKEMQRLLPFIKKYKAENIKDNPNLLVDNRNTFRVDDIKDNQYIRQTASYVSKYPDTQFQYMVNEFFTVNMDNAAVTFTTRRGRLGVSKMELTEIRELTMKDDYKSTELKVTVFTADGKQETRSYAFNSIIEPEERRRLVRNYRYEIERAVRLVDKIIEKEQNKQYIKTANAIRDVDTN